jgi:hypothetical protein
VNIEGEHRIQAPREAVWRAINDPDVLRECLPGCEEIIQHTPTDWTAKVTAKVGPVKARFSGRIRLEDLEPPGSCRIVGEGAGGAAGFAKGEARVTLTEDGDATVLRYAADAMVGGKLAQVGSRLIESTARSYADGFFQSFAARMGPQPAGGAAESGAAVDPAGAPKTAASAPAPVPMSGEAAYRLARTALVAMAAVAVAAIGALVVVVLAVAP